uniref:Uncharacterized protein n=1 Tax=Rhizophora mucronata TaxID=61149 RepID=A0A2P2R4L3_RHIMU
MISESCRLDFFFFYAFLFNVRAAVMATG